MRNVTTNVISAADNQNTNGTAINSNQLVSASFQAVFGDTQAAGTFKLQASNDYELSPSFSPANWTDIPNQSASITSGGSALLTIGSMAYQWIRATYTSTATGTQTVHPVPDVAGSLNSTYFLLQDEASVHLYYVWLNVNSAGVDPMIAGRTGVPIAVATGATASTIGTAIASAVAALNSTNSFDTSGTTTVTITNKTAGPFMPITDGATPTGFTFMVTAGGSTTLNVRMNALSV